MLSTEDDLAVSLRFLNFGSSPPSSEEDSGLSSFVENPQYFCGIIKEKDMCEWWRSGEVSSLQNWNHVPGNALFGLWKLEMNQSNNLFFL